MPISTRLISLEGCSLSNNFLNKSSSFLEEAVLHAQSALERELAQEGEPRVASL